MKQNSLNVIGITGGIASGKSTITNYLIAEGYIVIDADKIAREVVEVDSVGIKKIEEIFSKNVINRDKTLNRKKLRAIVFNDKEELNKLNKITHPLIISEIKNKIAYYLNQNDIEIVFLDCPLLFEMGLDILTNSNWLISSSINNQINRLKKRDNITTLEAENIISFQMPLDEKRKKADIVIENNGTIEKLINNFKNILNEVQNV
ncbi:MAG: dephospho-CoA kinase [Bacillota bacterium]|nr:dephospho-CoA kinase [Bacillota bacterium]